MRALWLFWASLVAQLVKNLPAMLETWEDPWVGKIPWRREWLPIPVFWPGEFHGLYSPWGCKELDMVEQLSLHCSHLVLDQLIEVLFVVILSLFLSISWLDLYYLAVVFRG